MYTLHKEQILPVDRQTIWDFIATPANLQEITPSYMGFDITSDFLPKEMYEGMIISYKVSPILNIPMEWVTEITHIKPLHFFVDQQLIGPYRLWHHQHILEDNAKGVLMRDIVSYQPPFGILGKLANGIFIKKQLESIFEYRRALLEKKFC